MSKRIKEVIYNEGGYDETKPNNNVISTEYYSDAELAEVEAQEAQAAAKAALLERLGITEEEAKLLLG